jgi:hypothetical protein
MNKHNAMSGGLHPLPRHNAIALLRLKCSGGHRQLVVDGIANGAIDWSGTGQPLMELTAGIPEACVLWSLLLSLQSEVALTDLEILGRVERRRKWTAQEKAEVAAETGQVAKRECCP